MSYLMRTSRNYMHHTLLYEIVKFAFNDITKIHVGINVHWIQSNMTNEAIHLRNVYQ